MMRRPTFLAALIAPWLLASCAAPPPPPSPPRLVDAVPLAEAPTVAPWPTAQWWKRYDDAVLDQLVDRVLREAAGLGQARLRAQLALQSVQRSLADARPVVDAQARLQRQQLSDNGLFRPEFLGFEGYSEYSLGVGLRHSLDWWGRQAAAIAAAGGEAKAAQAEQAAVSVHLAATASEAYFRWQADQRALRRLDRELQLLAQWQDLVQRRQAAQLDDADALRRVQLLQARNREERAAVEGSVSRIRLVVAALLGLRPAELPQVELHVVAPPAMGLPADASLDLLARRPDLVAARWRVEAAAQRHVEARAAFYPDISLQALAGLSSIDIGRLFDAGSFAPSAGLALNLPLFDGGLREARLATRDLEWQAAADAHRDAVLAAAREVGEALNHAGTARALREPLMQRQATLRELVASATARVRNGTVDDRARIGAELDLLSLEAAFERNDLELLLADVALQAALGGGFDTRDGTP